MAPRRRALLLERTAAYREKRAYRESRKQRIGDDDPGGRGPARDENHPRRAHRKCLPPRRLSTTKGYKRPETKRQRRAFRREIDRGLPKSIRDSSCFRPESNPQLLL